MNGYATVPNQQKEIMKLSQKISLLEQKLLYNEQKLQHTIQTPANDPTQNAKIHQQGLEIEQLKYQNRTFFDWRKAIEAQMDEVKHSMTRVDNSKRNIDFHCMNLQEKINLLEKLQYDLTYFKEAQNKGQSAAQQMLSSLQQDFMSFKSHYSQEAAHFASVLNDHTYTIDTIKSNTEDTRKLQEETKNKFTNLVFDLKASSQIASEASERTEILERDYSELKRELNQIKLDMEILESLVGSSDVFNKPGRLLWKVTDVSAKLERAKDFGSVIKSPVFFTHEYGYKIRVRLKLQR